MTSYAEYLNSNDFRCFADETLREAACGAVAAYLDAMKNQKVADPHQLYTLKGVAAGTGLGGLRKLAREQKERNTSKTNKEFWIFFAERIGTESPGKEAFPNLVREELQKRGLLSDETVGEKPEKRAARRANRGRIDGALERALSALVEHFVSEYAYQVAKRKGVNR
ncbi:MAG: hypothetical protein ACLFRG_19730 [Desulfococcaceae bacterium]